MHPQKSSFANRLHNTPSPEPGPKFCELEKPVVDLKNLLTTAFTSSIMISTLEPDFCVEES